MGFNVVDQSYSGTYSNYFITRATYAMDTVRKGLVFVKGDIKKKHTIARLDYNNPLKVRQAVPTTDNTNPFTLDGRLLIPNSVDVYEEFNPRDLEENQLAEQLSTTILDREVPQNLQSQLVQLVLNRVGEKYEDINWIGSKDYAGLPQSDPRYQYQFLDGFIKRFVNDATIIRPTISEVTITTSNIFDIMNHGISRVTTLKKALITDPMAYARMGFAMSPNTADIYTTALATGTTFKGNALNTGEIAPWKNYPVHRVAGMPDNTIIFCRLTDDPLYSNLYLGMNSMQDWELKIQRTANANETFFIQGKWKWDVNYGWGDEIFMYTTLTPASFIP